MNGGGVLHLSVRSAAGAPAAGAPPRRPLGSRLSWSPDMSVDLGVDAVPPAAGRFTAASRLRRHAYARVHRYGRMLRWRLHACRSSSCRAGRLAPSRRRAARFRPCAPCARRSPCAAFGARRHRRRVPRLSPNRQLRVAGPRRCPASAFSVLPLRFVRRARCMHRACIMHSLCLRPESFFAGEGWPISMGRLGYRLGRPGACAALSPRVVALARCMHRACSVHAHVVLLR